jgi:predicted transcriptional regulator
MTIWFALSLRAGRSIAGPNYAKTRSNLAKTLGLGERPRRKRS